MGLRERVQTWRTGTRRAPLPATLRRAYRRWLVDEFTTYYYNSGPVWDTRPTLIVETGTFHGGSALFFAHVLEYIGEGEVLSIDLDHSPVDPRVREHPRISLLTGDSTTEETRREVLRRAEGRRVMLYLDADHRRDAVLAELRGYADLVTPGCYAVVADSIMGGHPVPWPIKGETYQGPYEAVETFLRERNDFVVDDSREYQLATFNPRGFLLRR